MRDVGHPLLWWYVRRGPPATRLCVGVSDVMWATRPPAVRHAFSVDAEVSVDVSVVKDVLCVQALLVDEDGDEGAPYSLG